MRHINNFYFLRLLYVAILLIPTAFAQDTRTVTEPAIPPSCSVLIAEKTGNGNLLSGEYELSTDTARIQEALDECKPGMAVELAIGDLSSSRKVNKHIEDKYPIHDAFLTGALELREGVTLLIDRGVTLYASRDPKDYDPNPIGDGPLLCGTVSNVSTSYITAKEAPRREKTNWKTTPSAPQGRPCRPLIAVNAKNAAIMGDGIIDGRGSALVVGHDYSWWQMARSAEPKQLRYYSVRMIVASHADGFILYGITLHNSANYHVSVSNTNGFTVWGVHLQTPTVKGMDARNTDGIDPGSSSNITITKSWIDNGDDNVAVKTGTTHMSVIDNYFYSGHGMSIGSETNTGDSHLLVDGLTEDHTTSGIRIKSNAARGGLVHDLTYRNICMRGVPVPIAISPYYNNGTIEGFTDPGIVGDKIPDYKNILLENIYDESPGNVLIAGLDEQHRTQITLYAVHINGIQPSEMHLAFADIYVQTCSKYPASLQTNLPLKDLPVSVKVFPMANTVSSCGGYVVNAPDPCVGKFVPMQ